MFWRSGQIRLKRQNKSSKMRDLLIRNKTCGSCPVKKTTSDGLIIFFPPFFACTTSHSVLPVRRTVARSVVAVRSIRRKRRSRALCSSNTRPSLAAGIPPPVLVLDDQRQLILFADWIIWYWDILVYLFGCPRAEKLADSWVIEWTTIESQRGGPCVPPLT